MIAFQRARMGTSAAARRVDAAAHALSAQREAAAERQRQANGRSAAEQAAAAGRRRSDAGQWAEDQLAEWARLQPHIVVRTFKPAWRRIVEEVAEQHGVVVDDLFGPSRKHPIVFHRMEAMYRIADETPLSLPEIGRKLGGKDHTTVLHGIRSHAARHGLPLPRQDDGEPS